MIRTENCLDIHFSFVNSMTFSLKMYTKFVWPKLVWLDRHLIWLELDTIISPGLVVSCLVYLSLCMCQYLSNIFYLQATVSDNLQLQISLMHELIKYRDLSAAAYWADYFSIDRQYIPPQLQDYMKSYKPAAKKRLNIIHNY